MPSISSVLPISNVSRHVIPSPRRARWWSSWPALVASSLLVCACAAPDEDDSAADDVDTPEEELGEAATAIKVPPCTHYVSVSSPSAADDLAHGSAALPFRHINYAVNVVPAGSKVCATAGTYAERVDFHGSDSITLTKVGAGEVVLDGTNHDPYGCNPAISIYGKDRITVSGLTIVHHGNPDFGKKTPGTDLSQCFAHGVLIMPSATHDVSNITIANCVIRDVIPVRDDQLGVPLGVGSYTPGLSAHDILITQNTFTNNDTHNQVKGIWVGAVSVVGDTRNFTITRNTFDDPDTGGVESGGNQNGNSLVPKGGLVADNVFKRSGSQWPYGAGVYLQAARDVVVERNFFDGAGIGVSVHTEPPWTKPLAACPFNPVLAGNVTVRNNVMSRTVFQDFRTGANLAQVCADGTTDLSAPTCVPIEKPCNYASVENVYFTNNTIFRPLTAPAPYAAILVVRNSTATLTGDNKIADNIVITPGAALQLAAEPETELRSDFNFVVTKRVNANNEPLPYIVGATDATIAQWQATGRDTNSRFDTSFSPTLFAVAVPAARQEFALSADTTTPAHDLGEPAVPGQPPPTTPPWLPIPDVEDDHFGGPRDLGPRRDAGADEH